MRKAKVVVMVVLAAACGGKSRGPENGGGADHAAHHDKLTPELAKFNDAIAPTWHAPSGEQRAQDACAAVDQLEANAGEVAAAQAPTRAVADQWSSGTKELTESVAGLKTACGSDPAAVEPALDRVHETLHGLIELAGGHHERDGTHSHL